jgi:hypothetical protein
MKSTLTCTDRAAIPAVLAAIQAQPGITKAQIESGTGIVAFRVKKVLTELVGTRRIAVVRTFDGAHWWPVSLASDAKKRARAEAKERRRIGCNAARAKLRLEAGSRRTQERQTVEDVEQPAIRWAGPSDPLPFVCRAPASVFHLGGML